MSGYTSRTLTTLPGPGRWWVTNTGPRVRPLGKGGSSRAVSASRQSDSGMKSSHARCRRRALEELTQWAPLTLAWEQCSVP